MYATTMTNYKKIHTWNMNYSQYYNIVYNYHFYLP